MDAGQAPVRPSARGGGSQAETSERRAGAFNGCHRNAAHRRVIGQLPELVRLPLQH